MRQLNTAEIFSISGAVLDLGDGVGLQVNPNGIPAAEFAAIESYMQAQIDFWAVEDAFLATPAAKYLDQYYAQISGGNYTLVII